LKAIFYLLVIGAVALVAFAYLGDLDPDRAETRIPVDLDGD